MGWIRDGGSREDERSEGGQIANISGWLLTGYWRQTERKSFCNGTPKLGWRLCVVSLKVCEFLSLGSLMKKNNEGHDSLVRPAIGSTLLIRRIMFH